MIQALPMCEHYNNTYTNTQQDNTCVQTTIPWNNKPINQIIRQLIKSSINMVLAHLSKSNSRTFQGLSKTIWRIC